MTNSTIKITGAMLNYYILSIDQPVDVNNIHNKLINLKNFDSEAKFVGVDLTNLVNCPDYSSNVAQIFDKIVQYEFTVLFVKTTNPELLEYTNGKHYVVDQFPQQSGHRNNQTIYAKPLVINETVRSGSEIYYEGDVIVNAFISHNAEIHATGNIHVYNECRGKLYAGVDGDKHAKIYASKFNAEAIAIGGIRQIIEEKLPSSILNKSVQVFLDDKGRINIAPLYTTQP